MHYPKHVALIPDGNRTRAKEQGKDGLEGHLEGFQRAVDLTEYAFKHTPIQVVTSWGLSTENLQNRSEIELNYLFEIYKKITDDLYDFLKREQINFRVVGDKAQLPRHLVEYLEKKEQELRFDTTRTSVLAINYGGQDEILRAAQSLQAQGIPIDKASLEGAMDFAGLPPLDLLIRTKQQMAKRLSGFMLWWVAYAQLYFTDLYFPAFTIAEFQKALERYDATFATQNFGK